MLFAGRGQSASRRGLLSSHSRERLVLPIHGEVARSAGGAGGAVPPHLWGGGAQRRRGWRSCSSPFMGRWRAAPEGRGELFLGIHGEVSAQPTEGLTRAPMEPDTSRRTCSPRPPPRTRSRTPRPPACAP